MSLDGVAFRQFARMSGLNLAEAEAEQVIPLLEVLEEDIALVHSYDTESALTDTDIGSASDANTNR
jgi:hypothetical protein